MKNLITETNLSEIRRAFKEKTGKEISSENIIEALEFSNEFLIKKFVSVFENLTKYNGELEKRIKKLENKK